MIGMCAASHSFSSSGVVYFMYNSSVRTSGNVQSKVFALRVAGQRMAAVVNPAAFATS